MSNHSVRIGGSLSAARVEARHSLENALFDFSERTISGRRSFASAAWNLSSPLKEDSLSRRIEPILLDSSLIFRRAMIERIHKLFIVGLYGNESNEPFQALIRSSGVGSRKEASTVRVGRPLRPLRRPPIPKKWRSAN